VVDVTGGPDVDVWFRPVEFGFSHDLLCVPSVLSVLLDGVKRCCG
jgi:hypothetical protein